MKYLYCTIVSIILCSSCNDNIEKILSRAESTVNLYPDSALTILSEIDFPEKLSDKEKADYGWLTAMAHSKSDMAMNNDSLILFSLNYYKGNDCADRLISSYELSIKHQFWNDNLQKADSLIEEGLQLATSFNDSIAIARFYFMRAELQSPEEAIISYRKVKQYNKQSEARADYCTAILYARSEDIDSAKYYFEKSIEVALLTNDSEGAHYLRNHGDYLYALRDMKGALREMQKALKYNPDYLNSNLHSTISLIYLGLNKIDSAQYFLDKAKNAYSEKTDKDSPKYIATNNTIFGTQIIIDYAKGSHIDNYRFGRYNDSLMYAIENAQSVYKEQLNIKNQLEERNLRLKIKHQNTQLLLTFLISFFIICGGLAYIYIRNKRQKLQEVQEKSEALERLLNDAKMSDTDNTQNPNFFKRILLQQLGLIRLVATSPTAQNQALLQQISLVTNDALPVDSLLVWDDLYPIIDSVYDGFYTKMHTKYKDILTNREIQLCCLLCANFSTKEISVVTQQSIRTIYQRKTTIRQKLQIDEKGDIVDFIKI